MATKRATVDLEAVERDYRTGSFTDRELGAKYGRSHTAVQKWARDNGWQKDLVGAVRKATEARLLQAEVAKIASGEVAKRVAKAVAKSMPATTDVVSAMADINTAVITRHRTDLLAMRNEAIALLDETGFQREHMPKLERLAELVVDEEVNPMLANELRKQFDRAVGLPARIVNAKNIADVIVKLQPAERVAFKLDDADPNAHQGKQLTELELAARLAYFVDLGRRRQAEAAE